eukprot:g21274.t1
MRATKINMQTAAMVAIDATQEYQDVDDEWQSQLQLAVACSDSDSDDDMSEDKVEADETRDEDVPPESCFESKENVALATQLRSAHMKTAMEEEEKERDEDLDEDSDEDEEKDEGCEGTSPLQGCRDEDEDDDSSPPLQSSDYEESDESDASDNGEVRTLLMDSEDKSTESY